jgi:hypothetical protein
VTRPRSRAPGHPDPVYRRSRLLLPVLVAMAVSACIGGGTPATPAVERGSSAPASSAPPTAALSPSTIPTTEPTATPAPIDSPTSEPTPSGSTAAGDSAVDGCTGTDDNRSFFAKAAADLSWPVYCAALPARWFVSTGSYSRAGGGKLEISYQGPNGAKFELREGAFCTDGTGCVPEGSDAGTATFGDQAATLVHFEDGSVAAVVDRGERLSWLAIGAAMSDPAFQAIAASLIRLD